MIVKAPLIFAEHIPEWWEYALPYGLAILALAIPILIIAVIVYYAVKDSPRFSLRTMLIVAMVIAAVCGLIAALRNNFPTT